MTHRSNEVVKTTLGNLGTFTTSSVDKLSQPAEVPVSLVNYMDVYRHRHIGRDLELQQVTARPDELVRFRLQRGDILFTPSSETPDDIGHSAVVVDDLDLALQSYHVVRLRPNGRIPLDLWFCGYMANTPEVLRHLSRQCAGSTRYTLPLRHFQSTPISIPPIEQQRRIAEILGTVDRAIRETEALIAKQEMIKAGMMHDLFTRGVLPNGELRPPPTEASNLYKDSPLGLMPKEWKAVELRACFDIQLGKMLSKAAKTGMASAPYVGNKAVQWDLVDSSSLEEMDFYPTERLKYRLLPGDLLVCEGGDVGRTAMWVGELDECYYQKAIHRLRERSADARSGYVLRYMKYAHRIGLFREYTSQSSIAHLTQEKLGLVPLLVPVMPEQIRIEVRLGEIDGLIAILKEQWSKLRGQKDGLLASLLRPV